MIEFSTNLFLIIAIEKNHVIVLKKIRVFYDDIINCFTNNYVLAQYIDFFK